MSVNTSGLDRKRAELRRRATAHAPASADRKRARAQPILDPKDRPERRKPNRPRS